MTCWRSTNTIPCLKSGESETMTSHRSSWQYAWSTISVCVRKMESTRSPANSAMQANRDKFASGLISHRSMCFSECVLCPDPIGSFRHIAGFSSGHTIQLRFVCQSVIFWCWSNHPIPLSGDNHQPSVISSDHNLTRFSSKCQPALLQWISSVICFAVPISGAVIFQNISLPSGISLSTINFSRDSLRFGPLPSRRCSTAINYGLACRLSNELANDEFRW